MTVCEFRGKVIKMMDWYFLYYLWVKPATQASLSKDTQASLWREPCAKKPRVEQLALIFQACEWATLKVDPPAHSILHMTVTWADKLTATSWKILSQNHSAKMDSWPRETVWDNTCLSLYAVKFWGNLLYRNR